MARKERKDRPVAKVAAQTTLTSSSGVLAVTRGTPEIVRAKNVQRELINSPTFVSLYTNDTQIQVTPWDVRLILGEITNVIPSPDSVTVKLNGEVRMSPQHAKRIVQILTSQIALYEKNIGPLPLPPD